MKTFILTILLIILSAQDYSSDWKIGYVDGYCYKVDNCIEPIVPIPPLPDVGEEDEGYNDGFLAGLADK